MIFGIYSRCTPLLLGTHVSDRPQSTVDSTIPVLSTRNQDTDLKISFNHQPANNETCSWSKCNIKLLNNHNKSYEYCKRRTKPITHSYLTWSRKLMKIKWFMVNSKCHRHQICIDGLYPTCFLNSKINAKSVDLPKNTMIPATFSTILWRIPTFQNKPAKTEKV